jgi:hypothetical protein
MPSWHGAWFKRSTGTTLPLALPLPSVNIKEFDLVSCKVGFIFGQYEMKLKFT